MANRILASMQFRLRVLMAATGLTLAALQTPSLAAAESPIVLNEASTISAKAPQSVLLAVTRAGSRVVAVGERGIILLSDDAGVSWRQVSSPSSVSLTAVQFVDDKNGWAVGHLGVVLHSADGGETWARQLDGVQAAEMLLAHAKQGGDSREIKSAELMVADGPDKPFLDVQFIDSTTGFIVGAYGLIFKTTDGGTSWQVWSGHVANPESLHLNGIAANGNNIFIVGERGLLLRSTDGGDSFEALQSPYEGSYFGALSTANDGVFIYGLRGNAYRSADNGASWQKVNVKSDAAISSAVQLHDGSLVLVSQAGEFFISKAASESFETLPWRGVGSVSDITETSAGELTVVGLHGLERTSLGKKTASN